MTYQEVWTNGLKMLQNAGIEDARECTGVLFERVYGIDAAHFILHRDEQAPAELRHEFRMLIERRSHHEPLQYIMGSCGFMNWDFFVDRSVLIPRQDTETLVEEFLADITRVISDLGLSVRQAVVANRNNDDDQHLLIVLDGIAPAEIIYMLRNCRGVKTVTLL